MLRKGLISCALAIICLAACNQDVKPVDVAEIQNKAYAAAFEKFGINTANLQLYYSGIGDTAAHIGKLTTDANVSFVRFPGGTTANFYHPDGKGYGYRNEDLRLLKDSPLKNHMAQVIKKAELLEKKRHDESNYILHFSQWAKANNLKVMYVANLMSGSIHETMQALEIMKTRNVEVIGVELGNEYYLNAYASVFPSVSEYEKKAMEFASEIRKAYPALPVSVVAAPSPLVKKLSEREKSWNQHLEGKTFYDAVSLHFYPLSADAAMVQPIQDCSMQQAIHMARLTFSEAIADCKNSFADKPIWLTEWNVMGAPKWCSNSSQHNVFIFEMLNQIQAEPSIKWAAYHTLISKNQGFNILSSTKNGKLSRNQAYWPFHVQALIRKQISSDSTTVQVTEMNGLTICNYSKPSGKVLAQVVWSASNSQEPFKLQQPERANTLHFSIDESGLIDNSTILKSSTEVILKPVSAHLFLREN
jgi:hypothetical protein